MRRVVTALVLVMVAVSLVACSSGSTADTTGTPAPATGVTPPVTAPAAAAVAPGGDVLSPQPASTPAQKFPTDVASVPQAVLDNIAARKPMLVFWYDPTTNVSTGQRTEINAAIKDYAGRITLVAFDYTTGIPVGSSMSTLPAEIDKAERMTGLLKVNTTPYLVFVDASGQITGRFAGYVDRGLIEREVMRATQ